MSYTIETLTGSYFFIFRSPEWRFIAEHDKEELGLTFDDDGEFWMSFKDFQKYFDRLEICNLSPDSLTDEDIEIGKKKWEMSVFEGDWVRGVTAGGCRNYLRKCANSPLYSLDVYLNLFLQKHLPTTHSIE